MTNMLFPLPDTTVGRVIGLIEVIYSYGVKVKISFLSEELGMPMDELGPAIDMAEMCNLIKVKDGVATLTVYGEAVSLGTIENKKKIIRRKLLKLEVFKYIKSILKKIKTIKEDELFEKLKEKYAIQDKEKVIKLLINWGTYANILEYNSDERTFSLIENKN